MNLTELLQPVWDWFWADPYAAAAQIVTALAIVRELARHLEAYLIIWLPQTPTSRFWLFWARLMATLDQASLSAPRKASAIRALYEWKRGRDRFAETLERVQQAPKGSLHYLGIGLNRVDPAKYGGWDGRLNACHNDVIAIQRVLPAPVGQLLLDEQATSAAVDAAYTALANTAQPGDLVVIARSGHGGQFADRDNDERDGADETMVLYDRQVTDDEHALWLMRFKAGVRVLLITDTCHSQSVARAVPDESGEVSLAKAMPAEICTKAGEIQCDQIRAARPDLFADLTPQASVLLLAACEDSQVAWDGQVNGRFTGALLQAWDNGRFSKNHSAFLKAIRNLCKGQTPQLTGYGRDKAAVTRFSKQRPFTI